MDNPTWMVGTRKGLFFVRDDKVVDQRFLGEPVTAALRDPRDGTFYVATGNALSGALAYFDGAMWSTVALPVAGVVYDVWGTGPIDVLVVGEAGLALRWDGTQWAALPGAPVTSTLRTIRGGQDGDDLAALTSSGKVLVHDGLGWLPVRGVEDATSLAVEGEQLIVGTPTGVRVLQHVPQP